MSAETATTESLPIAKLDLKQLPLSEIFPHPDNPRIHPPEQIKELQTELLRHGYFAGSMGIQKSTRRLYKGHGVYEALLGIGCIEADFVVKDLTDAETLALLARDNQLGDMSTNDPPKLKLISVKLLKMSVPIERMGYTLEKINEMAGIFYPTDGSKQSRLDRKKPAICPECGHEFIAKN